MKTLSLFILSIVLLSCADTEKQSSLIIKKYSKCKVLSSFYDSNNQLTQIEFEKDSLIKTPDGNVNGTKLIYDFYPNGNIKEVICQGSYAGMGMAVGTSFTYDMNGKLFSTIYYHNNEFGKDYIIEKYYKEGIAVDSTKYNNYLFYETEKVKKEWDE